MADLLREIRVLRFLQMVTLVVLMFLALAVLVQAAPVDSDYESCQILAQKEAKQITLANYRHLNINPIQIKNNDVSFVIKHVNRLIYANHLTVGNEIEIPDYKIVVTQIENDNVKVCLKRNEEIKLTTSVVTKTNQNSENDILTKEDILKGNKEEIKQVIVEIQNPSRKLTTVEIFTEALSTSLSHRFNTLFF